MVNGCQFIDFVLLNGELEGSGEEQDDLVSRWLRAVCSGRWCIAAAQVANVVDRCAADHTPRCKQGEFLVYVSEVPGMGYQF